MELPTWIVFLLFMSTVNLWVSNASNFVVIRDHSGDKFTTQCQDCRTLRAQCGVSTDMWLCCSMCKCYSGDTYFISGKPCYVNPSTEEKCSYRMEKYQYNGQKVPIYQLFDKVRKEIGQIVREQDYDVSKVKGCKIISTSSTYYDPVASQWKALFTDSRNASDFYIYRDFSRLSQVLEFAGLKASDYQGMLIKFSLRCDTFGVSCLMIKVAGSKNYAVALGTSPLPRATTLPTQGSRSPTTAVTVVLPTNKTAAPLTSLPPATKIGTTTATNVTHGQAAPGGGSSIMLIIIAAVLIVAVILICIAIVAYRRKTRKPGNAILFSLKPMQSISRARLVSGVKRNNQNDELDTNDYLTPVDSGLAHHYEEGSGNIGNPIYSNKMKLPLVDSIPISPVYMDAPDVPYAVCEDKPHPTTEICGVGSREDENIYADPNAPNGKALTSSYQALDEASLTRDNAHGYVPLDRSTLLRNKTDSRFDDAKYGYATIAGDSPRVSLAPTDNDPEYHVVNISPSADSSKKFDDF